MENDNIDANLIALTREQIPNATAVLVLGILSLVFGCCYGLGLPMAIIALVLAKNSYKLYRKNPNKFVGEGNLKAGKICAIIGLCISGVYILIIVGYFILVGSFLVGSTGLLENILNP